MFIHYLAHRRPPTSVILPSDQIIWIYILVKYWPFLSALGHLVWVINVGFYLHFRNFKVWSCMFLWKAGLLCDWLYLLFTLAPTTDFMPTSRPHILVTASSFAGLVCSSHTPLLWRREAHTGKKLNFAEAICLLLEEAV